MGRTIFRGTTVNGGADREAHVYECGERIVVEVTGLDGSPILDEVSLDLTMAMGLAVSLRDRVRDIEDRRNGWEDEA